MQRAAAAERVAGRDRARERVARDGERRRQPDQLGEVATGRAHRPSPSSAHIATSASHCSREPVLVAARRVLEEEAEVGERSDPADLLGAGREPGEVEDERRGERRVAAVPGELHRHPHAEEAVEGDMVRSRSSSRRASGT